MHNRPPPELELELLLEDELLPPPPPVIISVKLAEWVLPPPVPVTVMVKLPFVALLLTVIFKVELPGAPIVDGEKPYVTLAGKPLAVRLMLEPKLPILVVETASEPLLPLAMVLVAGDALMPKSAIGLAIKVALTVLSPDITMLQLATAPEQLPPQVWKELPPAGASVRVREVLGS